MHSNLAVLPEPLIEFRYGQAMEDPHDGLSLLGPYDADMPAHPRNISYGVIGTTSGLHALAAWCKRIQSAVFPEEGLDAKLWPVFPGFEAAFACVWPSQPAKESCLNEQLLNIASRDRDEHKRAFNVVSLYVDAIRRMQKSDDTLDVIICVVPEIVYANCRPQSRVQDGLGYRVSAGPRRERQSGQLDMLDEYPPDTYAYSVDFRRQIKARAMEFNIPIQIVRESALRLTPPSTDSDRRLTPISDRAWNLGVALYYKSGGKPWRLTSAREGVCYIGLAYRRKDPKSGSRSACCAAQMFLDTGDGIVFMGEYGPWYSPYGKDFHLSRQAACRLLTGALKTYEDLEGGRLREIFLHCRSGINKDEFSGFQDACPSGVQLVGVRVRRNPGRDLRLYREGKWPVLRGTFWQVDSRAGYLWASGFKTRLGTYDGWETPVPLRIDIQHGPGDILVVAKDIFALTKLNYNACRLGDSDPVTVGFSDAVGEVLVSNPQLPHRSPKFKFYI